MTVAVLSDAVEYVRAGHGTPAMVLINGAGGPIEGWHKVFGAIAGFATVFAFNGPGIGGSSKPSQPQLASRAVASLRAALAKAGLAPPYVLAGHSWGGLIANPYARLHPAEVAALVLIEATAPGDVAVFERHRGCLQRLVETVLNKIHPLDANAETRHAAASVAELLAAPAFPPIPLFVLTGGKPAPAWATPKAALAARAEHQRELALLSPRGRQLVVKASGHFPQFSEPALVIETIRQATLAVR